MPIIRTYACESCFHQMEVTLTADEWDAPPPDCPRCSNETHQEFKPVAIGGSNFARAARLAEDIASNDYQVADMQVTAKGQGDTPKVRYKDARPEGIAPSVWGQGDGRGFNQEFLESAAAIGRQARLANGGSGLDVLHANLRSGAEPDLIELSKRRSIRVG